MDEQSERSKRECNLIVHNIPESEDVDTDERKLLDISKVKEVLEYLDVSSSQGNTESKPLRLGKTEDSSTKPRLLRKHWGEEADSHEG